MTPVPEKITAINYEQVTLLLRTHLYGKPLATGA